MLPKLFGSLRFRIVAYTLLAFALVLLILSVYIFTTYERYLRSDFDARLREAANIVSESISITADATITPVPQISPFRFQQFYFVIRSADGRVLERSKNLGTSELPFSAAAQSAESSEAIESGILETIREGNVASQSESGELRLLTIYHHGDNTAPYFLQMASSLDSIDRSISELRRTLSVAFLIGLVVAGVSAFLVAWRSVRSISDIARQAKELNAAKLDRRIVGPNSDDEVAYLVFVINGMLDRLQKAFNAQERFIADVSHELRTPLSILLGEAQVLTQQERSIDEYDQFVGSVQEEMRRLAQVVNSLLTLARAHAGFPIPAASSVSLYEVVLEAVQRNEPLAKQRQIRLVPALAMPDLEGSEPIVEGDFELLCTMASNLIRNAVRYSFAKGSVEIRVTTSRDTVTLLVADRGPGLPPEHISSLFDRFYQVPKSGAAGSGLGLAIAKGVAELHKGRIQARNRPGGGSEFSVDIPLSAPELVGMA